MHFIVKKLLFFPLLLLASFQLAAQKKPVTIASTKPKLVVGIVVDQMRWDFLYRYQARYGNTGFKRLLNEGFTCENAMIPYAPTVTAIGHATVYTGTVPNIHGMTGNAFYDSKKGKTVYCTDDADAKGVGSNSAKGKMSPKNLLANTIGDELHIATNYQSKVIGVAIKDRGGILPAGHSANAAYWYDESIGKWITSTYYMDSLPQWMNNFNNRNLTDSFYGLGWNTMYPINTYTQSTGDEKDYEGKPFGNEQKGFPYSFDKFKGRQYGSIATTPYGNSMTLELAKTIIAGERMGNNPNNVTDLLCVSLSSTDYVGHSFGPNSIETEDTYLRLDKDLGNFLSYLDATVGKGQYTVFLTADHGVAHIPGYLREHKMPGTSFDDSELRKTLNSKLKEKFGVDSLIVAMYNYQAHIDHPRMHSNKLDEKAVIEYVTHICRMDKDVAHAFPLMGMDEYPLNVTVRERIKNGYYPFRSGDVQFILKPGSIDGGKTGTTHGLWNPYDSHIPMVFMGWGIKQGKTRRETYMTDFAPTICALLNIQMPNGCVGKVVEEVLK